MNKYRVVPETITFSDNNDERCNNLIKSPFITTASNPFDAACEFLQYDWPCGIEVDGYFDVTLLEGDEQEFVDAALALDALLSLEELDSMTGDDNA